jgi:hypothetical protein
LEKTIYYFSRFKLFILAHTFVRIRHRQAFEFVGSLNLHSKIPKFWYPIARIQWHWLDSSDITEIRQQLPEFGNLCQNPTSFGQTSRNLTNTTEIRLAICVGIWPLPPDFCLHHQIPATGIEIQEK